MTQVDPARPNARFKRRRLRTLIRLLVVIGVLMVGAASSLAWLKGRELAAPPWLKTRIAEQIERALPDFRIVFGDILVVVDDAWLPRFSARNLQLLAEDGSEILSVADVRAGMDTAALLDRKLMVRALDASGIVVTLRRKPEGTLALRAGGDAASVESTAPTILQMVGELDGFLQRPELAELASVDVRAVTLRYEDQRAGRAWTVDGARARLDREGDSVQIAVDLAVLGGASGVATLSANYAGIIEQNTVDFGITLAGLDARDIASQGPAFAWMAALQAPISGALRGGLAADGTLNPLNVTFQIGAGVIQPTPEADAIPIDGARSYFTYFPDEQLLRFDELSVRAKWGSGRLEGQAQLGETDGLLVQDIVGQFRLSDLVVNPGEFYLQPVEINAAELDFRLRPAPFLLEFGRLQISDAGQVLNAQGRVSADAKGWDIAVDAQTEQLTSERLLSLWPAKLKPKTRSWISRNVKTGLIRDAVAAVRAVQGGKPRFHLGFDFEEALFTFTRDMPAVEGARGHASLDKDRFVIVFEEGKVNAPDGGLVDAAGTTFIVPDTTVKPDPPGIVRLSARGSVTSALSLLDRPPLHVMRKAGMPVDLAGGEVVVDGTISLPLKKDAPVEEVTFDVAGQLSDVISVRLVKDRELAARRLDLRASQSEVRVAGRGTLDGVPIDVVWRQGLARGGDPLPGRVTGTILLAQETLDAFGIDLPPGMVQGTTTADLDLYLEKDVPPKLELRSDLVGAKLNLPPLGWTKPQDQPGELTVDIALGATPRVERLRVDAPGLFADGAVTLTSEAKLERVRFETVRIGNWLDAPVDLVSRGEGRPVAVVVRGGVVDLRNVDLPERQAAGGDSSPLTLYLNRLQISDTIALTDLNGSFATSGGLAGRFEGSVNGAAPVSGQVSPQGGRSAVRLTAPDAGNLLSASGIMKQVKGGAMDLLLVPVGSGGAFDGKLTVADARLTDAPAIAALLNSISGVGLINELNGDGIFFSEVTADFRLAPSRITLRQAAATGASMGLSMDGVFDPDTGRIQMQGVISPIFMLNSIGSVLTRRGEGLFGFNYSISGTARDPQVFVNPLTALAPGMFRNLFRGAEPEVPLEEGETAPTPEPRRTPVVTRGEDR